MSPDPVSVTLSSIDQAVAADEQLRQSMERNAERFHPFGPAAEWATTRGWVPKVSPPTTRYEALQEEIQAILRLPDPFEGPVPSPTVLGSVPAEPTVDEVHSHRAPSALRLIFDAFWKRVSR